MSNADLIRDKVAYSLFNYLAVSRKYDIAYKDEAIRDSGNGYTNITIPDKGGVCKDFSFSAYRLLHLLGYSSENIAIAVVRQNRPNPNHAVAAVKMDDGWKCIDMTTVPFVYPLDKFVEDVAPGIWASEDKVLMYGRENTLNPKNIEKSSKKEDVFDVMYGKKNPHIFNNTFRADQDKKHKIIRVSIGMGLEELPDNYCEHLQKKLSEYRNNKKYKRFDFRIELDKEVKSIPPFAFAEILYLTEADLSKSGVVTLPVGAFYGCTRLKTVKLPKNLAFIGAGAFGGSSGDHYKNINIEDTKFGKVNKIKSLKALKRLNNRGSGVFGWLGNQKKYTPEQLKTDYKKLEESVVLYKNENGAELYIEIGKNMDEITPEYLAQLQLYGFVKPGSSIKINKDVIKVREGTFKNTQLNNLDLSELDSDTDFERDFLGDNIKINALKLPIADLFVPEKYWLDRKYLYGVQTYYKNIEIGEIESSFFNIPLLVPTCFLKNTKLKVTDLGSTLQISVDGNNLMIENLSGKANFYAPHFKMAQILAVKNNENNLSSTMDGINTITFKGLHEIAYIDVPKNVKNIIFENNSGRRMRFPAIYWFNRDEKAELTITAPLSRLNFHNIYQHELYGSTFVGLGKLKLIDSEENKPTDILKKYDCTLCENKIELHNRVLNFGDLDFRQTLATGLQQGKAPEYAVIRPKAIVDPYIDPLKGPLTEGGNIYGKELSLLDRKCALCNYWPPQWPKVLVMGAGSLTDLPAADYDAENFQGRQGGKLKILLIDDGVSPETLKKRLSMGILKFVSDNKVKRTLHVCLPAKLFDSLNLSERQKKLIERIDETHPFYGELSQFLK